MQKLLLTLLFLGDNAAHKPAERFRQLEPAFADRGIKLVYTDKADDLNPATLAKYDGLMLYANTTKITPDQEKALLDYVEGGKGFVPLHCASFCFQNSPKFIALVGAQFKSHKTGTFRVTNTAPDHPVMKGFGGFESWDETYVHAKHNTEGRTVLETREDEPWTWVREQGKGRVFYTAWGHDQRTWANPGFHNLVERGVRWACRQDPAAAGPFPGGKPETTAQRTDLKPFEYEPAEIPLYVPNAGARRGADRQNQMQKPLPAEESVKHYVAPKGFEVRTFVTEEKLGGKPLAMTWDERGRLWVSLTRDYPNELQREGEGRDRIVCCEDADGDGVCDTVTTFAEKLSIPTSLLPFAGGLIVTQAPHTLFLKDTDGDGKADVRQVLFTGWATNDTHAGPSNLRYGFDNWVYGAVGYAGFRGEVAGESFNFKQGFFRFKVDPATMKVSKLEFLRSTNNNTWGLGFTEDGLIFGSTANGRPIVYLPIPNRYYEKVRGLTPEVLPNIAPDFHFEPTTDKVRQVDWHGGFTAAAGLTVYTARTYPPEYWNKTAFICEPTGHLVATMALQPKGADFTARYGWNLLSSDDEWAAPIQAEVGPDGQMWVIDWYNFIVQHNPTPTGFQTGKGNAYEIPLRDKTRGRIYRVVYTGAKGEKPFTLKDATPEKLVETLKHPNLTWRLHAQRLLVERGKDDLNWNLSTFARDEFGGGTGLNAGVIHALWTLQGLNALRTSTSELDVAALKNKSAAVRRTVTTLFGHMAAGGSIPFLESGVLTDSDPQVRLAALLAVADAKPSAEAGVAVAGLLPKFDGYTDKISVDALTIAAAAQDVGFLATVGKSSVPADGLKVVQAVAKHFAQRGADDLPKVLTALPAANPEVRDAIVSGLASGWPTRKAVTLTPDAEAAVGKLLADLPPVSRARLMRLAAGWGVKGLDAQINALVAASLAAVADPKADDDARLTAARQAIEFRPSDADVAAKLLAAVTPSASPTLAAGLLETAANGKASGMALVGKLKPLAPAARAAALRVVLARPDAAKAFLDAVEAGDLRFDMLALDQRTALAAHPDRNLSARAKRLLAQGGGLPDPNRQKVIDELKAAAHTSGDVANGKKLFVQHCAKCHKHGGEGQQIGPDLTGMAAHPKEEMLVAVLDPSRSVEGNFRAYTAETADGRVITGLLASETKTSVELIDAENKRHAIQRDALDALKESSKSLMPEGFEKQVKPQELADLLEFLAKPGRFLPLPLDKVATAVSTRGMFNSPTAAAERMAFADWSPKTVDGVPFVLTDPQGTKVPNVVLLYGPSGSLPPTMPKAVSLPCNTPAKGVHLLGGVAGWASPLGEKGSVSLVVRLHYAGGATEDHALKNGEQVADYIRRVDVPGSKFAFDLQGGKQVRLVTVTPAKPDRIERIELVKGPDGTAPVVMAVTVETRE